jgi:DNA-binding beta-propeller fold protein YncE
VIILNLALRQKTGVIPLVNEGGSMATSPDGKTLFVGLRSIHNAISVTDSEDGSSKGTIECTDDALAIAVPPGGRRLYALCGDLNATTATLVAANTTTFARSRSVEVPVTSSGQPYVVIPSPDGRTVYVSERTDDGHKIQLFDAATLTPGVSFDVDISYGLMNISPDGRFLYAPGSGERFSPLPLRKIDASTGQIIASASVPPLYLTSMVVSSQGDKIYLAGSGYILQIRTADMTVTRSYSIRGDWLALTPDGASLFTCEGMASSGGIVINRIDTKTGQGTQSFATSSAFIDGLTVSPDGKSLYVAASIDGALKIELATGAQEYFDTLPTFEVIIGPRY